MKMWGRNNLALLWLTVVNAIGQPPGTTLWEVATGNHYGSAPALAQDGTIYVGGYPGKFFALNPNGTVKWTYALGGEIWGSPAIGADGTIYATSSDQKIYAFDPAGTKLWDFNLGGWVFASVPAIGADGSIYVGASALFALEPDGRPGWQFQARGLVRSPVLGPDAVEEVIALLKGAQIAAHQHRPLVNGLQSACASFERMRMRAGAAQLAAFQHKVRSQIAPVDQVLAGALIQAAQKIIDAVSGPAVRPKIISAGQDLDRHFRIQFAADAGPTYFIQSSSNLIRWMTVGTAIRMKDGSFEFEDSTVAQLPSLYYRIVSPYPVGLSGSGQSSTESGLNH